MQRADNFRVDIQGLRGIAVLLVVLYHLDLHWLAGGYIGVDIFFVISGYLITGHLIETLNSNRFGFIDFYARRVRRIIPASLFVLSCTAIIACLFLPPLLIPKILKESIATALYLPNVFYAHQQTDYLAETSLSPLLHYWSLGVEEQFYFMWPLLMFFCWRLFSHKKNYVLAILVAVITASFVGNLYLTQANQSWAFFLVFTRAWELGAGGLLAFLLKEKIHVAVNARLAVISGWYGLVILSYCALMYNEYTVFPGVAAALPVFGALLMLFAGAFNRSDSWMNQLLGNRLLQYLGMVSYSLYLWHWPIIIFAKEFFPDFGGVYALVVLFALSLLLADLTYRLIEQPFRYNTSRFYFTAKPAIVASLAGSVFIVLAAGAYNFHVKSQALHAGQLAAEYKPQQNPEFTAYVPQNLAPDLRNVSRSVPEIYNDNCHDDLFSALASGCEYGNRDAKKTYVLFGDSHAAQWFPALERYSSEQGIRLVTFTKSACPAIDVKISQQGVESASCREWRKKALMKINQLNPEAIIIANYYGSKVLADDPFNEWGDGLKRVFSFLPKDARVIIISDTPNFARTPAICLSQNLLSANKCALPRNMALDTRLAALEEKIAQDNQKYFIDMNNYLCTATECGPIIGNLMVYRDQHHITIELSEKLSNALGDAIKSKLYPPLAHHH